MEDFAETWLPDLLARFGRAHPKVRVEARVDRGSTLVEAVQRGILDLALTWGRFDSPHTDTIEKRQIIWIGPPGYRRDPAEPFPLVAFDEPCAFRTAAIEALESEQVAWRHVFASPSLSGLWAAVTAGLGVTARTIEGKPSRLSIIDPKEALMPPLGSIELVIHTARVAVDPPVAELRELILEAVACR